MVYKDEIADRVYAVIKRRKGFREKKMFGGIGFLLNNNMCVGVYHDYLILRLGVEQAEQTLKQKNTKPFDITGRPMKGWVMVSEKGFSSQDELKTWIDKAIKFVRTLPAK